MTPYVTKNIYEPILNQFGMGIINLRHILHNASLSASISNFDCNLDQHTLQCEIPLTWLHMIGDDVHVKAHFAPLFDGITMPSLNIEMAYYKGLPASLQINQTAIEPKLKFATIEDLLLFRLRITP